MSIRVMSWVFEQSRSKGIDRLVLLAIGDHAHDTGRNAYPSMSTLTRKTGLDKRTVQRAIRALVDLGELTVDINAGPKGSNRYHVHVPKGWRTDTGGGSAPLAERHPPRQNATGPTPPPVADSHRGQPATGGAPGGVAESRARGGGAPPEPSLNQTTSHPSSSLVERNAPGRELRRIVKAYADAGIAAGNPPPAEAQRDVENSARSLLEQGFQPHVVEAAARNAGTGGWRDLTRQIQIDNRPPSRPANGRRTTDDKVSDGLALAQRLLTDDQPRGLRAIGGTTP